MAALALATIVKLLAYLGEGHARSGVGEDQHASSALFLTALRTIAARCSLKWGLHATYMIERTRSLQEVC